MYFIYSKSNTLFACLKTDLKIKSRHFIWGDKKGKSSLSARAINLDYRGLMVLFYKNEIG
jgi:hypothetical protein